MSFRNDGLWRKAGVVENGPAPLCVCVFFLIVCFSFGCAESPLLLGVLWLRSAGAPLWLQWLLFGAGLWGARASVVGFQAPERRLSSCGAA